MERLSARTKTKKLTTLVKIGKWSFSQVDFTETSFIQYHSEQNKSDFVGAEMGFRRVNRDSL